MGSSDWITTNPTRPVGPTGRKTTATTDVRPLYRPVHKSSALKSDKQPTRPPSRLPERLRTTTDRFVVFDFFTSTAVPRRHRRAFRMNKKLNEILSGKFGFARGPDIVSEFGPESRRWRARTGMTGTDLRALRDGNGSPETMGFTAGTATYKRNIVRHSSVTFSGVRKQFKIFPTTVFGTVIIIITRGRSKKRSDKNITRKVREYRYESRSLRSENEKPNKQ